MIVTINMAEKGDVTRIARRSRDDLMDQEKSRLIVARRSRNDLMNQEKPGSIVARRSR